MIALALERLCVQDATGRVLVAPFDLSVAQGGTVTLVGESGAGKSLVCAAIAGTLPPGLVATGQVWVAGRNATALPPRERQRLWAHSLVLLPQEPRAALAPARRILPQTADTARLTAPRKRALETARSWLSRLGLDPDIDGRKHPWALSGGMAQRAAVAAALGAPAPLVLVDEPTKGLDAPRRAALRDSLQTLTHDGRALVLVTHDLTLAKEMGGELLVLRDGHIVDRGDAEAVLAHSNHPFTRALVNALPQTRPTPTQTGPDLLHVHDLALGRLTRLPPLQLTMRPGEIVGLCGPSGSGKTTFGDTLLGLHPPAAGRIVWRRDAERPGARQKLYQDPAAAFAPWRPIHATLADALAGTGRPRATLTDALAPLLPHLHLDPGLLSRRPAEVSGGELQRLAIARILLGRPVFLFADEPTSRLDPLTQRDVLQCLAALAEAGTACLLASHDPAILGAMTSRVVPLYRG